MLDRQPYPCHRPFVTMGNDQLYSCHSCKLTLWTQRGAAAFLTSHSICRVPNLPHPLPSAACREPCSLSIPSSSRLILNLFLQIPGFPLVGQHSQASRIPFQREKCAHYSVELEAASSVPRVSRAIKPSNNNTAQCTCLVWQP